MHRRNKYKRSELIKTGNRSRNASYTVEAAFIIPVMFILVLLVIEITFYCYDRARLQMLLNDTVRKAVQFIAYDIDLQSGISNESKHQSKSLFAAVQKADEADKKEIQDYCWNRMSTGMILSDIEDIQVEASVTRLEIEVSMDTKLLFALWIPGLNENGISTSIIQSAELFPREEKTRIIKAVFSLGKKVKGVSEGLERIADFLK